jgi:hypothetical protein
VTIIFTPANLTIRIATTESGVTTTSTRLQGKRLLNHISHLSNLSVATFVPQGQEQNQPASTFHLTSLA